MYKMRLLIQSLFLFCCCQFALASNIIETVTLKSGKQVVLKSDNTWEYATPQTAILPIATETQPLTKPTIETKMPVSSTPIIENPTTAKQLNTPITVTKIKTNTVDSLDGIEVQLIDIEKHSDKIGLKFKCTNTTQHTVIRITANVSIINDNNQVLKQESITLLQSIKRMPETYLRKGQTQESSLIWIKELNTEHWEKRQLKFELSNIDTW